MKTIEVFCDDISTWLDESLNTYDVRQCLIEKTGEPYLEVTIFGVRWTFYIYGMNNTDKLPISIQKASHEGCRPDIWFYDPNRDEILLAIEETSTAPVGNAQKQRIPRPLWAIQNNVPFIFVFPKIGMDNSNSQKREITGPFKVLANNNPQSFIDKSDYQLLKIMDEVSKGTTDKFMIKSPFNLKELGKTKISVKGDDRFIDVKNVIDSDLEVYNVIEKTGNIYMVPKKSKTAKYLGFKIDTILIIGKAWKSSSSSGYSDPLAGGILMVYYINEWSGKKYNITLLSTHDCSKNITSKLIQSTNKMTYGLSKIHSLIDLCGDRYKVTHNPNENFKFKGLDESITTYSRAMSLKEGYSNDFPNKNINIDFCQGPHGSWSSNDGLNTQKRDKKRGDIYHIYSPNGEEGKTKLSDVYKHIEKYGLIHDKYYYLIEDCVSKNIYSDKIIKVSFI